MKKLNKLGTVLCAALFGSLAVAEEAAVPSKHNLKYALDAGYRLDGKKILGDHNLDYSYKVNDDYTLKAQVDFTTNREKDAAGEWNEKLGHKYFRMSIFGPTFAEVMGFKAQWAVRYMLPTDTDAQLAGTYGTIVPRIYFTREFSPSFNLTVVPGIAVQLNRSHKQFNDPARADNVVGSTWLEVVPQFVLMKDLTLTADVTLDVEYTGYSETKMAYLLDADYELLYNIESLGNLGLGLFVANTFNFGNHQAAVAGDKKGGGFFRSPQTTVGLRVQKSFGL